MDEYNEYEITVATTVDRRLRQTVKRSEPIWTDGAGREIPLSQMDTSHILNCIQLLDERRTRLAATVERYNEEDNVVSNRQIEMWDDSIKAFFEELRRRGVREKE